MEKKPAVKRYPHSNLADKEPRLRLLLQAALKELNRNPGCPPEIEALILKLGKYFGCNPNAR